MAKAIDYNLWTLFMLLKSVEKWSYLCYICICHNFCQDLIFVLRKLKVDTSSAQSFKALKSFFTYVDDLEHIVNKKRLDSKEFREVLNQLTGLQVSEEESEFIFRMLDANKDGLINTENELKFSKSDK